MSTTTPFESLPAAQSSLGNWGRRPRRALASKWHRLSSSSQRAGNQLIESLSEFMSARNDANALGGTSELYDKLVSNEIIGDRLQSGAEVFLSPEARARCPKNRAADGRRQWRTQASSKNAARGKPSSRSIRELAFASEQAGAQWTEESRRENNNRKCHHQTPEQRAHNNWHPIKIGRLSSDTTNGGVALNNNNNNKRGAIRLLGALLSGRHEDRAELVAKLLRAPVILAAMFSFALIISLLILSSLSFHQHHLGQLQLVLCNTTATATKILVEQSNAHNNDRLHTEGAGGSRRHLRANHLTVSPLLTSAVATTKCATYEGHPEGRGLAWRGVAYASPPVGERRWAKPVPIWLDKQLCQGGSAAATVANRTVVGAHKSKAHCIQLSPFSRRLSGQEDCLYLDVFAPKDWANRTERLPVMVYIHGGFLAYGSGQANSPYGDGVNWLPVGPSATLAAELQVVLVAPNFRLQALGFMALRELAMRRAPDDNGPDGSEGNYGLWDQVVALDWVQRNIGAFGGDPKNVVLFGPDSASALPLALLSHTATPAAVNGQRGTSDDSSASSSNSGSLLFRAAWLTNPTVFYELPYQLANQHYARLIKSQSTCSGGGGDGGGSSSSSSGSNSGSDRNLLGDDDGAKSTNKKENEYENGHLLRECLMNLSPESVVREYLGKDDPSYRLDDQSSLPIRNIFPDQFVTLDGQLVRNSYPFKGSPIGVPPANLLSPNLLSPQNAHYDRASAIGGQDSGLQESPRQTNDTRRHATTTTTNTLTAQAQSFLVGSSAQAVEYWPCPRNLYDWSWDDFRRYVGTSLNSFSGQTYEAASTMYKVPLSNLSQQKQQSTSDELAIETYLTMVSDIRQVCPINQLCANLRDGNGRHAVHRYFVEWRPSAELSASLKQPANGCGLEEMERRVAEQTIVGAQRGHRAAAAAAAAAREHKPKYAFHYWDLLAFFGFNEEFSGQTNERQQSPVITTLKPQKSDLKFQRHIRKLVANFVWAGSVRHKESESRARARDREGGYTVFTGDQEEVWRQTGREYKQEECQMWQKFLKQSYAWLS